MDWLGVFDKQMESRLKHVSYRIDFLFNEIMVYEDQGINNTESYLRKLAKDVVQELPVIQNPDMEGRNLVTKTKIISMEKQQAEEEMIEMLLSEDFDIDTALVSVVSILGMAYTGENSLAHHIILDQRVQDHFDIKLWIDISRAKTRVNIVRQVIG